MSIYFIFVLTNQFSINIHTYWVYNKCIRKEANQATKTKTKLNVNLDIDLKNTTAETLQELGLDFTTAINIYFKQIVIKKKIPFEISMEGYYTAEAVMGEN
ncbi:hypothetical protein OfM1_18400 [Lactovum odontotermitis]